MNYKIFRTSLMLVIIVVLRGLHHERWKRASLPELSMPIVVIAENPVVT